MRLFRKAIIVSLWFISTCSQAQTPNYLMNGAQWRISSIGISFSAPCWIDGEYVCEITGDTLIGAYSYKKIIHHGVMHEMQQSPSPSSPPCSPDYTFSQLYALIRQENLKMYIYDTSLNLDTLLYDFDLQVGDLLPVTYNNSQADMVVNSISTITVGSEIRNVFHVGNNASVFELVEGIGHNLGFIGTMQPFEFAEDELVCFAINDVAYYPSLGAACDLNVGLKEIESSFDFNLFPNPSNETLRIELKDNKQLKLIEIVDYAGKSYPVRFTVKSNELIELDLVDLASGIYQLKVKDVNDHSVVKKFVKL